MLITAASLSRLRHVGRRRRPDPAPGARAAAARLTAGGAQAGGGVWSPQPARVPAADRPCSARRPPPPPSPVGQAFGGGTRDGPPRDPSAGHGVLRRNRSASGRRAPPDGPGGWSPEAVARDSSPEAEAGAGSGRAGPGVRQSRKRPRFGPGGGGRRAGFEAGGGDRTRKRPRAGPGGGGRRAGFGVFFLVGFDVSSFRTRRAAEGGRAAGFTLPTVKRFSPTSGIGKPAVNRRKPLEMTIQIQKTGNRCLPTGNRCLPTGNRRF